MPYALMTTVEHTIRRDMARPKRCIHCKRFVPGGMRHKCRRGRR